VRGPNWRGLGKSKVPIVSAVREATAEDVEALRNQPKLATAGRITKLRAHHHQLALCFAAGWTNVQIREETGRSLNSISAFRNDPMIQELVAQLLPQVQAKAVDHEAERIASMHRTARMAQYSVESRFQQELEDGDPVPLRDSLQLLNQYNDRFGPIALKAQVNVNATFEDRMGQHWEDRMRKTRQRTATPRTVAIPPPRVIDVVPTEIHDSAPLEPMRRRF
jgi:hypothetical protein